MVCLNYASIHINVMGWRKNALKRTTINVKKQVDRFILIMITIESLYYAVSDHRSLCRISFKRIDSPLIWVKDAHRAFMFTKSTREKISGNIWDWPLSTLVIKKILLIKKNEKCIGIDG